MVRESKQPQDCSVS